jgi:hypothetical protein
MADPARAKLGRCASSAPVSTSIRSPGYPHRRRGIADASGRADTLEALAPHLPEPDKTQALSEALTAGIQTKASSSLIYAFALSLPIQELFDWWTKALPALASGTRLDLHRLSLLPVLVRLGGEGALQEMFRAIHDVSRWWP